MSGPKTRVASRSAHVTMHQAHGQKFQGLLQMQQQLRVVKERVEQAQARNTALSAWIVKWHASIPVEAIEEWNRILEEYQ